MKVLVEQAERLTLSSRAFFNDKFPVFAAQLTSMFGYDMVLPMNTGAEGVETAIKLARKWGYEKKKIPKNEVRMPKLLIIVIFSFYYCKGFVCVCSSVLPVRIICTSLYGVALF